MVGVAKKEGSGPVAGDPGGDADDCGHGDEDGSPHGHRDIVLGGVVHPEAEQRGVDGDGDGDVDEAGEDMPGRALNEGSRRFYNHGEGPY